MCLPAFFQKDCTFAGAVKAFAPSSRPDLFMGMQMIKAGRLPDFLPMNP